MKKLELKCWGFFLAMLFIMAAPLLLSGCRTALPPEKESTVITVKETLHDTTFIDVPDSSAVKALIECQNGKPVLKQIINATPGRKLRAPTLTLKNDTIGCDCRSDSLKLYAFWKSKQVTTNTEKQIPVLVDKPLKWWQKTLIGMGFILLIMLLVFGGWIIEYKLKK
ncbi:hypothetical protein Q765_00240 [Flavobacterium rivuli WB 3.3-2 = DSM 21788]|uniref:Lipoprotein n=1 Tax=Flavobacterium rivuli WB 3.3-2 = DSM 21788 TaxID=1121895 RepID=A0A0A2M7X8_9FLAO|nr:hypothetical protein [Flavobacterium rivuli]KGO88384.1 hypothetical protein Q765_00240 [Flavobacterium rivuli WB 3.3-2 = DSM 21788]